MHLALVDMEIGFCRIRQSRCSHIGITVSRQHFGQLGIITTGENQCSGGIRREVSTGLTRQRRIDKRIGLTGITLPSPIGIPILAFLIVKLLGKRYLLGGTYTETVRAILGSLAAPCADLLTAVRADINQVELARLQRQVVVITIIDITMINDLLRCRSLHFINCIRVNRILGHQELVEERIIGHRP